MNYVTHVVQCPVLNNIGNGQVTVTGYDIGDRATYSCRSGYELIGITNRVCQNNGQWSGQEPQCNPIGKCEITVYS